MARSVVSRCEVADLEWVCDGGSEGSGRSVTVVDGAGGSGSAGGLAGSSLGAVTVEVRRTAGGVRVMNPWKTE